MKQEDKLWFDICKRFSEQSKCRTRKVGCVIVYENKLIGQGYNGAPEGSNTSSCPRCEKKDCSSGKDLESAICSHAEANAIGYCARHGISTRNAILYCTTLPCSECAKLIVAAGIKHVIYAEDYPETLSKAIFENANIHFNAFPAYVYNYES